MQAHADWIQREMEGMEISNKEVHDIRYLNIDVLYIINKYF